MVSPSLGSCSPQLTVIALTLTLAALQQQKSSEIRDCRQVRLEWSSSLAKYGRGGMKEQLLVHLRRSTPGRSGYLAANSGHGDCSPLEKIQFRPLNYKALYRLHINRC